MHAQAQFPGRSADAVLVVDQADGQENTRQVLPGNGEQCIGLVLPACTPATDSRGAGVVFGQPCVMSRGDIAYAERVGDFDQPAELNQRIAANARVGRAPAGVLGGEVVDDGGETVGQVEDVQLDAERIGDLAYVVCVIGGIRRKAQMSSRNLVSGGQQQLCRHRRIHAAAHRDQHLLVV